MSSTAIDMPDDVSRYLTGRWPYAGVADAEQFALDNDWSGFGLLLDADRSPLRVPGRHPSGHRCRHLLDRSNAETALSIINDAAPCGAAEWQGLLAYDHGNPAARKAASAIAERLATHPVLDEDDHGARERASAVAVLVQCYDVPAQLADDVVSALGDDGQGLCTDCHSWDLDAIMTGLGHAACAECGRWTPGTAPDVLHEDCATTYAERGCDCVPVMVDTLRHNGLPVTRSDVRETLRGCAHCYPRISPYRESAIR